MKKIILVCFFGWIISSAFAQFQDSLFIYKSGIPINKFGFNQIDTITFKNMSAIDSIFFYKGGIGIYKENVLKIDSLNRYDRFGKVKDIDGNIYRTIKIGARTWMAENLKVTTLNDGTHINEVTDQTAWGALATASMCWYNNDKAASFTRNGALYNWFTVDTKKLCPAGWHVPNQNEYSELLSAVGGDYSKLKMPGTEYWTAPNVGASNSSGFSLYPSGSRNMFSTGFSNMFNNSNYAYFWMSNQYSSETGKIMSLGQSYLSFDPEYKQFGFSIRCVKNVIPEFSADDNVKTYGDADFFVKTFSTDSKSTFTFKIDSGAAATVSTNGYVHIIAAGKVKIKIILLPTDIFAGDSIIRTVTIAPKKLIVTVGNLSKIVGTANPTFYSIFPLGFVDGEGGYSSDGSIFGTYLSFATTAKINSPVGNYPIVASGTSPNPNYIYSFVNGVLSVNNPGPKPHGPVKDVEGNTYQTAVYGKQIWMTENLRTTKLRDGTKLSASTDATTYSNYKVPALSWYNNDSIKNYATYGGLYNWYAVKTGNLCPVGWHGPSVDEWDTLIAYLGTDGGGKMKRIDTTAWNAPNTGATNSSGFNAIGAGTRKYSGAYSLNKMQTNWWTTTGYSSGAYYLTLSSSKAFAQTQTSNTSNEGNSVRCIKNDTIFEIKKFKDTTVIYGSTYYYSSSVLFFNAESNLKTIPVYSLESGDCVELGVSGIVTIKKAGVAKLKVTFPGTQDYAALSKTITITILKKIIPIYPADAIKIQGTSNPMFTIKASSFVTGDDISKIDVLPTATTTATLASPIGEYPVTLSGGSDDCYEFQYQSGSLKVIAASNAVLDIQGNVYSTVQIGTQIWMGENLKATRLNNNTPIPLGATGWSSLTTPAYVWQGNDSTANSYGGALYNFFTVQTDNLCPTGWHVPTDAEWSQLENFLIQNGFNYDGTLTENKISKSLASANFKDWNYTSTVAGLPANDIRTNNTSGFNGKPNGNYSKYGTFDNKTSIAYWWSSTAYGTASAMYMSLSSSSSATFRYNADMKVGCSVRCVKN